MPAMPTMTKRERVIAATKRPPVEGREGRGMRAAAPRPDQRRLSPPAAVK